MEQGNLGQIEIAKDSNRSQIPAQLLSSLNKAINATKSLSFMKNSSSILGLLYKVLPNALNYYDQARYYYSKKQYDIAETHIKQALELDPAMINGHIQYGEINFEQSNFSSAVLNFIDALNLNPNYILSYAHLVRVNYYIYQNYEEVIQQIEKMKTLPLEEQGLDPPNIEFVKQLMALEADSYNKIGNNLYSLGDFQKANEQFKKSLECDPTLYQSICMMGITATELDKPDEAILWLNKGLEIEKEAIDIYCHRARAYNKKQDIQNALKDLNTAYELKPLMPSRNYDETVTNFIEQCIGEWRDSLQKYVDEEKK